MLLSNCRRRVAGRQLPALGQVAPPPDDPAYLQSVAWPTQVEPRPVPFWHLNLTRLTA